MATTSPQWGKHGHSVLLFTTVRALHKCGRGHTRYGHRVVSTCMGSGMLFATIRRGIAKPDYLVVDLVTGMPGCSGAVTLYGKPEGRALHGASYDATEPSAPVCDINFDLDASGTLNVDAYGDCNYYHGGGCIFDGTLTKDK